MQPPEHGPDPPGHLRLVGTAVAESPACATQIYVVPCWLAAALATEGFKPDAVTWS